MSIAVSKARFRITSSRGIEVIECPEKIRECCYMVRHGPNPVMIAYLLYVGKAEVVDEKGRKVDLEEFVKIFGDRNLWILFSTYLDLRRRGKVPDVGVEPNELVIDRERVCIYVYEENAKVRPSELLSLVERGLRKDCRVMIAVVDMYGDVTYYEVTKMVFPKIERR